MIFTKTITPWYARRVIQRSYGQYCGLARALELVGERWALLVIRDLFVSPKRFTDLHRGLPGIPTNILTARLKELERAGVVHRQALSGESRAIVYELTDYGRELEQSLTSFSRWGAKALGDVREGEVVTPDSLVMALRTTFRSQDARTVRAGYELHLGDIVLHARVDRGTLEADATPLPSADLVFEAGPRMRELMAGEITASQAINAGIVRIVRGDVTLLEQYARLFRIDPTPAA